MAVGENPPGHVYVIARFLGVPKHGSTLPNVEVLAVTLQNGFPTHKV
jgi:hypothetical protein